jgi:hypothetical protein
VNHALISLRAHVLNAPAARPVANIAASKTYNGKPKKSVATESVWLGPGRFVSMAAGT